MDDAGAADSKSNCRCLIAIIFGFVLIIGGVIAGVVLDMIHSVNYDFSHIVYVYIQDLYVASSALSNNGATSSVLVELRFEREKALYGVYYSEFEMTLFYSGSEIGSSVVEGFGMRRKTKRVDVIGKVEAVAMPWREALLPGNVGTMVVELRWPSNGKSRSTADVPVDASGHMKINQPIQFEFHQA